MEILSDKCEVCGKELITEASEEHAISIACEFCGQQFSTKVYCPNHHFICDNCHAEKGIRKIQQLCVQSTEKNPYVLAEMIMHEADFNMYGPEHHVLNPCVILTALRNIGISKPNGTPISNKDIANAIKRSKKIPGGWCGYFGS